MRTKGHGVLFLCKRRDFPAMLSLSTSRGFGFRQSKPNTCKSRRKRPHGSWLEWLLHEPTTRRCCEAETVEISSDLHLPNFPAPEIESLFCMSSVCLWQSPVCALIQRLNYWTGFNHEEYRLFGYKTPVRTSQETRYFSARESSQLMLSKMWGFHGSDYEECRLLGYKNPSSYFTGDTLRLRYRVQPVNAM
jgi:hypothetical protein